MKLAKVKETTILQPLAEVEKILKSNLTGLSWEIEHTEELFTGQGNLVKIYIGVCGAYSGVGLVSFISHGGGHVPYYIKLVEMDSGKTQVTLVVTGSEDVGGDWGDRNGNLALLLLEMCEKDCTHKTFREKAHEFFR